MAKIHQLEHAHLLIHENDTVKTTNHFTLGMGQNIRIFENRPNIRIQFQIKIFGCIFLIIVMCSVKRLKIKLKLQDLKLHRFGYKQTITLLHPLSDSPVIVKYRVSLLA